MAAADSTTQPSATGTGPTGSARTFRFGAVAAFAPNARAWTGIARRAEQLGYATLLSPDTLNTFEPFAGLSAAAAVTTTLRVGTFVLPAPYYAPEVVAWQTTSMDMISGGRFELGIGAGRPGAEAESEARRAAFGSAGERVDQVAETVRVVTETLKAAEGGGRPMLAPVQRPHPPILVAASAPRMFRLAAEHADTVTLGLPPQSDEGHLAAKVAQLRAIAGSRFDDLELSFNLAGVGEELPEWLSAQVGGSVRDLIAAGATALLVGTPQQMADVLRRRRDELGISYVSVNAGFMEQFAPVVELLAGT